VANYRPPKEHGDEDDLTKKLREEGCAPTVESSEEEQESDDGLLPMPDVKKKKG